MTKFLISRSLQREIPGEIIAKNHGEGTRKEPTYSSIGWEGVLGNDS